MKGFVVNHPEPRPVRYTRVFSEEELISALSMYLEANGISVPQGNTFVWGIEDHHRRAISSETVTLVIDSFNI